MWRHIYLNNFRSCDSFYAVFQFNETLRMHIDIALLFQDKIMGRYTKEFIEAVRKHC